MMMAAQTSKIKSFDAALEEPGMEEATITALKTSLSMSNILQHQQEQERLKKKMKKKKKAAKNNKKDKGTPKPARLEACMSTEEIGTAAYAEHPAPPQRQSLLLSRSEPSPTSSASRLVASRGGAWSDADDEILEFVREETPIDRRSVGSDAVATTTTTTTATSPTSRSPSPSLSPKKMKKNKDKKKAKSKHNGKSKKKASASSNGTDNSGSGIVVHNDINDNAATPRSRDDEEFRWDSSTQVAAAVAALAVATTEEEESEAFVDDTDDESGSCSSRYGWQFKNDKVVAGRDWAELYDNMKRHITARAPWREFAMLEEDAARVYAKRSDDFSCAVAPVNFQKNRYGNILPYNQNRVKLAVAEDQSDYVNASYVKFDDALPGFQDRVTYIAASAPIPSTVEDFYRMLWETETFGIVMLTRNVEEGRAKCHQYWPEENEKQTHGCFTVTNAEEIENKKHSFLIRRFVVEKGDETREITQYHYLAWPDHGVPDTSEPLEEIIKLINAQTRRIVATDSLKEPTLVAHCSAGIGRTGTFILIHTVLNLLFKEIVEGDAESIARWTARAPPTIDFVHLVQHMRNQRTCMISQPEQYVFCYQTVLSNLGRALQYTPRKGEPGSPSPKHEGRAGRKASLGAIPRQKSCVLF